MVLAAQMFSALHAALGRALICAGWLLLLLLGASQAHAQGWISERAVWTDTRGTASFEDARSASYTPYTGVLSKGFGRDVQWIRLTIDAVPPGLSDTLVLRIRPVFLDDITLFDPADMASGKAPRALGDLWPVERNEFVSLHHTFVIPAHAAPRQVWLRLSTLSTQLLHVEALTPRDMQRQEHTLWLVYSALLAVILSFMVWVFLAWLRDRDPVNGLFVLRQTILLLYTASYLGYHRSLLEGLLSPQMHDRLYGWLVLLTTGLSILFEYRLLREYVLPRWGHGLLRGCLAASALALGLFALGLKGEALSLNMLLNAIALSILLIVSLFIRMHATPPDRSQSYQLPKRVLNGYYLSVALILALSILPSLGLFKGTTLSIYGVLLYGLISGLFMTTLLLLRSRRMEQLRLEMSNRLFLSQEQLALETRRREDQSKLLNMLMHELKTPLSVIDLALKGHVADPKTQGYVGRAIGHMKSILERCVQTDRLLDRSFETQPQPIDLAQQLPQWLEQDAPGDHRLVLQLPSTAPVHTDLQCVQIIIKNLVDNALKYGDASQAVHLRLQAQAHEDGRAGWLVQVSHPPGAAGWPDAQHVFAKYYRSPAAQRQSGTGLGLFLSHTLAEQLGAQLRYRPSATHICFELWLPT